MSLETKLKSKLFSSTALETILKVYPNLISQTPSQLPLNKEERRRMKRLNKIDSNERYSKLGKIQNQQTAFYIFNELVVNEEGSFKNLLYFTNPNCDYEIYIDYYIAELEPPIEEFETLEECVRELSKDIKKLGVNRIFTGELPKEELNQRFFNIFEYYDGREDANCRVELYRKAVNSYIRGEFKKHGIEVIDCRKLPDTMSKNKRYLH
ncbi:MAG: hypothetical protein LAT82_05760 [Nanoarchaeota archaeon]|nr:hypothetical protein [Nanoarchaeota archaeon]